MTITEQDAKVTMAQAAILALDKDFSAIMEAGRTTPVTTDELATFMLKYRKAHQVLSDAKLEWMMRGFADGGVKYQQT